MTKEEYLKFIEPKFEEVSPKERKIKYLVSLKGWKESELKKLKKSQLNAIIYQSN